jgi:putative ABC transport system permease protein
MNSLRLAFRQLGKNPGFTVMVVTVLALGVGATTAIFSVVYAVLLHPFPYKDADRLLFIGSTRLGQPGGMPVTYPDYLDWSERSRNAEHLAFANGGAVTLTGVAEATVLRNAAISASAWPLLGIQPVLGRVFTEAEDRPGAAPVCVLSHATWQSRFGGDPEIAGRSITLDGKACTVIGVMPPPFKFWAGDLWTPIGLQADTDLMRSRVLRMDSWVVGRPRPGMSADDVSSELNHIAEQLAAQYPDSNKDVRVSLRLLSDSVTGGFRRPLLVLLIAVACVLLIACANVANLLLARTATRQREYAVRAALGATRSQLVREMIMECLPLGLLGGIAGLLLGVWGLDALVMILPADAVPAEAEIRVNGPVMLFSFTVTVGTMILFALLPALESSRPELASVLQEGARGSASRRTGRIRAALIVAEVGLSLTLLVGAGLLIRSLDRLYSVDPGFQTRNLLVMPIQLPQARYATSQQATAFFTEVLEKLRGAPGIKAVAASSNVPFAGGMDLPLLTEGTTYTELNQLQGAQFSIVMGDHLQAQGLRLLRGRMLDENDRAGSEPVIVLNEAAVKRFIPDGDPLGRRVMLGVPENLISPGMLPAGLDKFQWATVVGVVQSTRHFGLQAEPPPAAYIPVEQSWDFAQIRSFMFLLVRTEGKPLDAVPLVRGVVASIDRNQPLGRISAMETIITDTLRQSRFNTLLLGLFAGVALTLAVVGIYGVVAWNVAQRTREIGIRQALGADRSRVLRLVVGQAMRVVLIGLLLGTLVSLAVAHTLQSMLYELSALDPWTFVLVALVLALSALVACVLPAWRATRVDPLVALRTE